MFGVAYITSEVDQHWRLIKQTNIEVAICKVSMTFFGKQNELGIMIISMVITCLTSWGDVRRHDQLTNTWLHNTEVQQLTMVSYLKLKIVMS